MTYDNCDELRTILSGHRPENFVEQCTEFFDKYKGRVIEFDGKMTYVEHLDYGTTDYRIGIYSTEADDSIKKPYFIIIEPSITIDRKGLDAFDFSEIYPDDMVNVHVKGIIEYYDDYSEYCRLELIQMDKR